MGGCAERATFEDSTIKDDRAQMVIEYLKQQEEDQKRRKPSKKFRKTSDFSSHESDSEILTNRKSRNTQPLVLHPIGNFKDSLQFSDHSPPEDGIPTPIFGGKPLIFGKALASMAFARTSSAEATPKPSSQKENLTEIEEEKLNKGSTPQKDNFSSSSEASMEKKRLSSELENNAAEFRFKFEDSDAKDKSIPLDTSPKFTETPDSAAKNEFSQYSKLEILSPQNFDTSRRDNKFSMTSVELEKQAFGVMIPANKSIDLRISQGHSEQIMPLRASVNVESAPIEEHASPRKMFNRNFGHAEVSMLTCLEPSLPVITVKEVVIEGSSNRPLSPRIENSKPKFKRLETDLVLKGNEKVMPKLPSLMRSNPFSMAGSFAEPVSSYRSDLQVILEGHDSEAEVEKQEKIKGFGLGLIHDSILDKYYEESELKSSDHEKTDLEGTGELRSRFLNTISPKESYNPARHKSNSSSENDIQIHKTYKNSEFPEPNNEMEIINFGTFGNPDYSADAMAVDGQGFQAKKGFISKPAKQGLRSQKPNYQNSELKEPNNEIETVEIQNFEIPDYSAEVMDVNDPGFQAKKGSIAKPAKKALRSQKPNCQNSELNIPNNEIETIEFQNFEIPDYSADTMEAKDQGFQAKKGLISKPKKQVLRSQKPNYQNSELNIPNNEIETIEFQNFEIPDYSAETMTVKDSGFESKSGISKPSKKVLRSEKSEFLDPKGVQSSEINTIEDIEVENVVFNMIDGTSELENQPSATFKPDEFRTGVRQNTLKSPDNLISTPELELFNIRTEAQFNPESVELPRIQNDRKSFSPDFVTAHNRVGGSDDELEYHRTERASYESPIRAESPNFECLSPSSSFNGSQGSIHIRVFGLDSQNQSIHGRESFNMRESFNIPDIRASMNNSGIFFKNSKMHLLRRSPRKLSPELFKKNLQGKLTAEEEMRHSGAKD